MAKDTTRYVCQSCGGVQLKWTGKCPACGEWNTLVEELVKGSAVGGGTKKANAPRGASGASPITAVQTEALPRIPTRLQELDRVLGGGAVPGGVVLVGGDPGVGKSTLLLQAMASMASRGSRALYVAGEEAASQVAARARRLGVLTDNLLVLPSNDCEEIESAVKAEKPAVMVIDSVQTVRVAGLTSAAGTVSQLREVAGRMVDLAQRGNTATFLVGHVTKDGQLAGPKVLEHLVDAVLSFEGERGAAFRALRVTKNRFGSSTEVGLFEMTPEGMKEVTQPSALFLAERPQRASGSVVGATSEGARSLLVEVQALVGPPGLGTPRRTTTGVDSGRLAMLLAVLARRASCDMGACDVFVNVAGGMRIEEPALDLPVALAIASSYRDRPFPIDTVAFGEVGLAGEVRNVPRANARIAEARAMGFRRVLLPHSSADRLTSDEREGIDVIPIRTLEVALDELL
ncbi:MAG: DNA repair protein RadA [Polyangiaceae bacterium]|jgi:DNA repair protein RadA/Sms|nr:DNA repair protein RadA [Polyangiaceae bacterium]